MSPEQRAHYLAQLDDALKKKKRALVAVCTLGLSETPIGMLFKDSEDTRSKMSFGDSPAGWIFKIVWFLLWTVVAALIFWIVNIFKLINYSVFVNRLQEKLATE